MSTTAVMNCEIVAITCNGKDGSGSGQVITRAVYYIGLACQFDHGSVTT